MCESLSCTSWKRASGRPNCSHAVQLDLRLPHRPVRGLSGDRLRPVAGHRVRRAVGVLDDERADVALVVASPDDDQVRDRAVADPALAPVQRPAPVRLAAGAGGQPHDVAAVIGLGERERSQLLHGGHGRQPAGLLLLGTEQADRRHRQPRVHGIERRHAAVVTRQLGRDQTLCHRRETRTAVALEGAARDAERPVAGHERGRKLRALPEVVGERRDLSVAVIAHAAQQGALALVKEGPDVEEVGAAREREVVALR
jgi:hypothetical protein